MRIIFNAVKLHNFMSYQDANIKLDRNGFILVNGINNNPDDNAKSNGTGKSTIFSAISWAITGLTVAGGKEVANIYLEGTTSVELDFTVDTVSYKVVRTKNPSNLKLYINDEDKSGKGIRDTEKILADYLPDITHSLLNSVIILGQGLPQKFTNNSPSGRKETLENLSNSDFMIQDLKNRVSNREKELKSQIRDCEDNILKIDTTKQTNIDILNKYNKQLEELNNIDTEVYKKRIEECQIEINKLESDRDAQQKDIEMYNTSISDYRAELKEHNDKIFIEKQNLKLIDTTEIKLKLNEYEVERNVLTQEISRLENIKDTCPTCGQKLPDVHKVDTAEQHNKLNDINTSIDEMSKELKSIEENNTTTLREFEENYISISNELNEKIDILLKYASDLTDNISKYNNKIIVYNTTIAGYQNEITSRDDKITNIVKLIDEANESITNCTDKMLYYNKRKDELQEHLNAVNKMNTALKRDFRGYLLSNVIDYISTKAKEYAFELFSTDKLAFELDGNNISINYDGKDYEVLSGGEKQKVDVIIQLSIRDMLCTFLNFSSNILVLDEITDNLDIIGSQKMFNLISTKLNDVEAIYIVSHHTDFEIPVDSEITVMKGSDKISRII